MALFFATPRIARVRQAKGAVLWGAPAAFYSGVLFMVFGAAAIARRFSSVGVIQTVGYLAMMMMMMMMMMVPLAVWYVWARRERAVLREWTQVLTYDCPACGERLPDIVTHVLARHKHAAPGLIRSLMAKHPELKHHRTH